MLDLWCIAGAHDILGDLCDANARNAIAAGSCLVHWLDEGACGKQLSLQRRPMLQSPSCPLWPSLLPGPAPKQWYLEVGGFTL